MRKQAERSGKALKAVLLLGAIVATVCVVAVMVSHSGGSVLRSLGMQADGIDVPSCEGRSSVRYGDGNPRFTEEDRARGSFEEYSPLDALGRCGTAFALIGPETMPVEERGSIGMVKPSGWHTARYDWIDGKYLFNRCHLIGYQLAGENDNELNLITGTRSMNTAGMEPYESEVAEYVRATGNHVLYRVTPAFEGDNLVASGVLMEAESVEDGGAGVRFCVWCPNVEPGVEIDYRTGESHADGIMSGNGAVGATGSASTAADGSQSSSSGSATDLSQLDYVLNTNTHRFHRPDCPSVQDMKEKNREGFNGTREELIALGYEPCGRCNP